MELLRPMPGRLDAWNSHWKPYLAMLQELGSCLRNDLRPIIFGKQGATGGVLALDLGDVGMCEEPVGSGCCRTFLARVCSYDDSGSI